MKRGTTELWSQLSLEHLLQPHHRQPHTSPPRPFRRSLAASPFSFTLTLARLFLRPPEPSPEPQYFSAQPGTQLCCSSSATLRGLPTPPAPALCPPPQLDQQQVQKGQRVSKGPAGKGLTDALPLAPLCCSPQPSKHWLGTGQSGGEGASACLQVIGVVEADVDGGHHPGLEERLEDLVGHRVRDEVKVEGIFPAKGKCSSTQHCSGRKRTCSPFLPSLPGDRHQLRGQMGTNQPPAGDKFPLASEPQQWHRG